MGDVDGDRGRGWVAAIGTSDRGGRRSVVGPIGGRVRHVGTGLPWEVTVDWEVAVAIGSPVDRLHRSIVERCRPQQ